VSLINQIRTAGLFIDHADEGTPLVDCHGSYCGGCARLFATLAEAEACCTEADPVNPNLIVAQ